MSHFDRSVHDDCVIPRSEALSEAPPWENTENIPDNVTLADVSEYFCTDETCEPVIRNVVVYREQLSYQYVLFHDNGLCALETYRGGIGRIGSIKEDIISFTTM